MCLFSQSIKPLVTDTDIVVYKHLEKGCNGNFYADYDADKIGYFVWSKSELERYKEDYCDTEETKEYFQHNIIDKFEEGKDCVTFDW